MLEQLLRQCLEDPRKRRAVIFLSFVLGLAVVWPVADQYFALRDRSARMRIELHEVALAAGRLTRLERMTQERQSALATLEAACVPAERLTVFRGEMVDLARQSGCQIRRIAVGETRQRPWREGDDPLSDDPPNGDPTERPYRLRSQAISIGVSGKLSGVRDFLSRLTAMDILVHANRFTMQAAPGNETETLLDLECLVFDLDEEKPAS